MLFVYKRTYKSIFYITINWYSLSIIINNIPDTYQLSKFEYLK